MASSSDPFILTQEQFKTFHNIDRILFTKLVHNLGRSPIESMQVIALWIWLEHSGQCPDLVNTMLKTWPDTIISSLADEAVLCLSCIESDDSFPFPLQNIGLVPLTQSITKSRLSLSFFRENRLKILHGVTKNVNEVCVRAFKDLVPHKMIVRDENTENLRGSDSIIKQLSNYGPILPIIMSHSPGSGLYDHAVQRQNEVLINEIDETLRLMQISRSNSDEQSNEVMIPPDERTIFLTFSKGYPISENEIRDFFIRKFGECFEAIHMQEVTSTEEQPLYARLIVYNAPFMDVVLEGKSKAKFSINGKHVWARKYVRKFHRSPPQPSSPSQQASAQT